MNNRLFAIGDIHGCFDSFQKLIEDVIDIKPNDTIVLLGDYIDRGSKSKEVVDYIIDLQNKGFNLIPLIGNHESMLLDTLDNYDLLSNWVINGCYETLLSFEISTLKDLDPLYVDFFRSLPFYYSFHQFLFVHAGFNDGITDPLDDKYQMIWARRAEYTNLFFKDKIIIHGHTPISEEACKQLVQGKSQVINIDTGCVYVDRAGYGFLSALELHSMKLFTVSFPMLFKVSDFEK